MGRTVLQYLTARLLPIGNPVPTRPGRSVPGQLTSRKAKLDSREARGEPMPMTLDRPLSNAARYRRLVFTDGCLKWSRSFAAANSA